jgi:hypothetical protein
MRCAYVLALLYRVHADRLVRSRLRCSDNSCYCFLLDISLRVYRCAQAVQCKRQNYIQGATTVAKPDQERRERRTTDER